MEAAQRNSRMENTISVIFCILLMLAPIYIIQYEFDAFTAAHGEARAGAAGAGLALAVVFRTVSRTVLRTIIRTSARAGMRATMKGAMRTAARTAVRGSSAGLAKKLVNNRRSDSVTRDNLKSLTFASALLYASWVIVIGLGQPYAPLMDKDGSEAAAAALAAAEAEELASIQDLGLASHLATERVDDLEKLYNEKRHELKMARKSEDRAVIEADMEQISLDLSAALVRQKHALQASGDYVYDPDKGNSLTLADPPEWVKKANTLLTTYAPYPGTTGWGSMVLWLGGLVMVLPLWLMYFVQDMAARKRGRVLRHETGVDGGFIQLYFAGAFSFMPLTSDVIVEDATPTERGRIALSGISVPTILAVLVWLGWKLTGMPILVFIADALLIYPMVQVFPLSPLEGIHLWRWNRLVWLVLFIIIMFLFMVPGSEALRSVI